MRFLNVLACIFLFSTLVLVSCSPTHKVKTEKLSNITVFYTDSEKQTQSVDFDRDSAQLTSVKTWIEKNKKGWQKYEDALPLGDILITSQNVSLNIGADWIILRQTKNADDVSQLRKDLSTEDRDYFETLR